MCIFLFYEDWEAKTMQEQVRFFGALSSEPRIRMLMLLKEHPQCVKALAERLQMTQPAVSQHLRVLKDAGVVKANKKGNWMHYEIDAIALASMGKSLAEVFGGWISPPPAGKGDANCPPKLVKECKTQGSIQATARRGRKG
jgi:DNA-binding transcriptional ArsR family regulator